MTRVVIATRNRHKLEEIRALLGPCFSLSTLNDFSDAPAVIEDAPTFAGNATKKAVELAKWLSARHPAEQENEVWVLADDSGLEVDALKGAPGVHSARFAALDTGVDGNSPDVENNDKLLRLLRDLPAERRSARFRCVIAVAPVLGAQSQGASPVCASDEFELQTQLFQGACEGRIAFEPRGSQGFGYDPLFIPEGLASTFAELGEEAKNRVSHRAKALAALKKGFHS